MCIFCDEEIQKRVLVENKLAFALYDNYPVTPYHCLIVPKSHIPSYFDLTAGEILACNELLLSMKDRIQSGDNTVSGFNIGINSGEDAGQTIFHCHMHLIPRRHRDVPDPRGGVRHVIAGKGYYR